MGEPQCGKNLLRDCKWTGNLQFFSFASEGYVSVKADGQEAIGDEACLEVTRASDPLPRGDDPDEAPPPISPNPIRPELGELALRTEFQPRTNQRRGIAPG